MRTGGWQFWVDFEKDHVIKTPKNRKEMKEVIKPYLVSVGKTHELNKRVQKMVDNISHSTKIIQKSHLPRKYLAFPTFLEKGIIKQRKVVVLEDYLQGCSLKQARRIIDNYFRLIKTLWEYGIHEKTAKFNQNYGILNRSVVLIDPFEISSNKKSIIKQLKKKFWEEAPNYSHGKISPQIIQYYVNQARKYYTPLFLNKYWKKKV